MSKRVTKKTIAAVTLEQANLASEQFAQTHTSLKKVEAKLNEEINKVRSKYQEEITELQEALEEPQETLEVFAKEQQANWGKKKSQELVHCIVGFRTGNPTVTKSKKVTWDGVVDLIKKNKTLAKYFIRTKDELNKEAILATKDESILGQLEEEAFVSISQTETFYVEPKTEEVAA
jgi:phage host-nuclease inhibitor protein Gam